MASDDVADDDQEEMKRASIWYPVHVVSVLAVLAVVIAGLVLAAQDRGLSQSAFDSSQSANDYAKNAVSQVSEIEPLSQKVSDLETAVSTVTNESSNNISGLSNKVDLLGVNVTQQGTAISGLQQNATNFTASLNSLQGQLTNLSTTANALQSQVSQLQNQVTQLQNGVSNQNMRGSGIRASVVGVLWTTLVMTAVLLLAILSF